MLPPGTIITNQDSFLYYDYVKLNNKRSMNEGHYHNFHEIYYLCSGTCEYLIDDKIFSLKENGFIFVPSGVIHKTIYTSSSHERIVISFTNDYIDEIFGEYSKFAWIHNLENKSSIEHIKGILYKISKECHIKNAISSRLVQCYMTELLAHIARHPHLASSSSAEVTPTPVKYAMEYISENFSQNITLEQIATLLNYNKDYFSKMFKRATGTGFKAYLLLMRLNTAEKLLLTTNKSIHDIAISCGFNDSNHFSTTFKKYYKISPRKMRTNYYSHQVEKQSVIES